MIIHILIILQIKIINNITFNPANISDITYAIPLIHGSNVYLFGNKKVFYSSTFSCFISSNTYWLNNTIEATILLYNSTYIITYYLSGNKFYYLKIQIESTSSSTILSIGKTLKENGNVCFCQMKYSSSNYYYSVWINRDSYINIDQLNF